MQGQGISREDFFSGLSPWLTNGHLHSVSSKVLLYVGSYSLLIMKPVILDCGLIRLFILPYITFLKALFSNIVKFWGIGELDLKIQIWRGAKFSPECSLYNCPCIYNFWSSSILHVDMSFICGSFPLSLMYFFNIFFDRCANHAFSVSIYLKMFWLCPHFWLITFLHMLILIDSYFFE